MEAPFGLAALNDIQSALSDIRHTADEVVDSVADSVTDSVSHGYRATTDAVHKYGWPVGTAVAGGLGGAALAVGCAPVTVAVSATLLGSIAWGAGHAVRSAMQQEHIDWQQLKREANSAQWEAFSHMLPGAMTLGQAMPIQSSLQLARGMAGALLLGTQTNTAAHALRAAATGSSVVDSLMQDTSRDGLIANGVSGVSGVLPAGAGSAVNAVSRVGSAKAARAAPTLAELMHGLPAFRYKGEALTLLASRCDARTGAHGFTSLGQKILGKARYTQIVDFADRQVLSLLRLLEPTREQLGNPALADLVGQFASKTDKVADSALASLVKEASSGIHHLNLDALTSALSEVARDGGRQVPTRLYNQLRAAACETGNVAAELVDIGHRYVQQLKSTATTTADEWSRLLDEVQSFADATDSAATIASEAGHALKDVAKQEFVHLELLAEEAKENISKRLDTMYVIAAEGSKKAAELAGLRKPVASTRWKIEPPQLGEILGPDATREQLAAELTKRLAQRDDLLTMKSLFYRLLDCRTVKQYGQAAEAMEGYVVELRRRLTAPEPDNSIAALAREGVSHAVDDSL